MPEPAQNENVCLDGFQVRAGAVFGMTLWGRPVDRDHDPVQPRCYQGPGQVRVQQQTVGDQLGLGPELLRRFHHGCDFRVQERFPHAPERHRVEGCHASSEAISRWNVAFVIVPIGSFQEWRMQVRQFRLQAEVGST